MEDVVAQRLSKPRFLATILAVFGFLALALTATDVRGANNNWCATYTKPENENCTFATFEQCQATVWGVGGWCRPNPLPDHAASS